MRASLALFLAIASAISFATSIVTTPLAVAKDAGGANTGGGAAGASDKGGSSQGSNGNGRGNGGESSADSKGNGHASGGESSRGSNGNARGNGGENSADSKGNNHGGGPSVGAGAGPGSGGTVGNGLGPGEAGRGGSRSSGTSSNVGTDVDAGRGNASIDGISQGTGATAGRVGVGDVTSRGTTNGNLTGSVAYGRQAPASQTLLVGPGPSSAGLVLPSQVAPLLESSDDRKRSDRSADLGSSSLRPLGPASPALRPVVRACRTALAEAASRYGATRVDVASTAPPRRSSDGGISAPMEARIVYVRGGRMQVRQAKVTCQFDANGQVVAAL
jgi:hypothetical protein